MKPVLVLAVAAACGGQELRVETAAKAISEVSGDAKEIRKLLLDEVQVGGLPFTTGECAGFAKPAKIELDRLDALARCLAQLGWSPSARRSAITDVAIVETGAFELELRVHKRDDELPFLAWVGFAGRGTEDFAPTITPAALEALRLTGDRNGPVSEDDAALLAEDVARNTAASAWVKLCIDDTGSAVAVPLQFSSQAARQVFLKVTNAWTFKPFTIDGQPSPACASVRLQYPATALAGAATMPLATPRRRPGKPPITVAPQTLERDRLAGSKLVVPSNEDKIKIMDLRLEQLVGTFRVCVDEAGLVEDVGRLRSTGLPSYDAKIERALHGWRYKPYLDAGVPVPVCVAVTFIYRQR